VTFQIQKRGGPQVEALATRFGVERNSITGLEEVAFPVVQVDRVDVLCCAGATVAAVSAVRSMVGLFNPAGSGIWTIIHEIWLERTTAGTISLAVTSALLETTNSTNIVVLERTTGNQPAPVTILTTGDQASVGTVVMNLRSGGDATMPHINFRRSGAQFDGIVLKPGRGIITNPSADNVGNTTSFLFSERLIP